jgi:hypothetical protein
MSTVYEDFASWFSATPGAEAYTRARGQWNDSTMAANKRFAVIQFQGGAKPDVDRYTVTVDLILLGKKQERQVAGALPDIENFAYSLIERSMQPNCTGRITGIRSIGGVSGPGYTAEDRPWWKMSFQLQGVELS